MAEEAELDLVEIAPTAVPPVCRIMDYGKFKYRESKKRHEAKLKQKQIIVKEVKFQGTFRQFLEHLRTSPEFYYKDPQELFTAYEAMSKRIDPQLRFCGRTSRRWKCRRARLLSIAICSNGSKDQGRRSAAGSSFSIHPTVF
jgi:translation initiation factor IF-3